MLPNTMVPPRTGHLDFSENRIDEEIGTMRVCGVLENPDEVLTPGLFGRMNVPVSLPYEGVLITMTRSCPIRTGGW